MEQQCGFEMPNREYWTRECKSKRYNRTNNRTSLPSPYFQALLNMSKAHRKMRCSVLVGRAVSRGTRPVILSLKYPAGCHDNQIFDIPMLIFCGVCAFKACQQRGGSEMSRANHRPTSLPAKRAAGPGTSRHLRQRGLEVVIPSATMT